MTADIRGDPADVVARVGRHWGWVLAFGIITLLVGIAALVWPGPTLLVVAVRHVLITLLALALLLGIFWIVSGAVEVFTALSHRQMRHRGWNVVMGIVS